MNQTLVTAGVMVISNPSCHPSRNIWLYINRYHRRTAKTVLQHTDETVHSRMHRQARDIFNSNVWLSLYKWAKHPHAWTPQLANVQQHVEARLNNAPRIPTSSPGKGTQRRQVATGLESPCTYARMQQLWQLCWYGSAWEPERWNVCPSHSSACVRAGGEGGALKGLCVLVEPRGVVCPPITCSAARTPIKQRRARPLNHSANKRSLIDTQR